MQYSSEQHTSSPASNSWLSATEVFAVVGSCGAAIAALVSQQFVAYAALPISVSLALGLANRNRMLTKMEQEHLNQITQLVQERNSDRQDIDKLLADSSAFSVHIVDLTQNIEHNQHLAEGNSQRLQQLIDQIEAYGRVQAEMTVKITHLQKATTQPDEFYYEDGLACQQAGQLEAAISSFNLAVKANESMAEAYYQRGLAKAEIGQRQSAIADLRTAASLFFDQGKLEQYQKAKDLSKTVHEALSTATLEQNGMTNGTGSKPTDSVNVGSLFN